MSLFLVLLVNVGVLNALISLTVLGYFVVLVSARGFRAVPGRYKYLLEVHCGTTSDIVFWRLCCAITSPCRKQGMLTGQEQPISRGCIPLRGIANHANSESSGGHSSAIAQWSTSWLVAQGLEAFPDRLPSGFLRVNLISVEANEGDVYSVGYGHPAKETVGCTRTI